MNSGAKTCLAVLIAGSFTACANYREYTYKQQVQLSNGAVVEAESWYRCHKIVDVGAGFQRGCLYDQASIRVHVPAPLDQTVEWHDNLRPFILDFADDGNLYFVGRMVAGWHLNYWRTSCPYVVFKYQGGGWQRIFFPERPKGLTRANLLQREESLFKSESLFSSQPRVVTLEEKARLDSDLDKGLKEIVVDGGCQNMELKFEGVVRAVNCFKNVTSCSINVSGSSVSFRKPESVGVWGTTEVDEQSPAIGKRVSVYCRRGTSASDCSLEGDTKYYVKLRN